MNLAVDLPELDAVTCERCGATMELTSLAAEVTCHHCTHRQALPASVRDRLSGYAAAVGQQIPAILASLDDAELFAFEAETERKISIVAVIFGLVFLLSWCVGPIGMLLAEDQDVRDAFGASCFVIPLLILPAIAVVRLYRWAFPGKKKRYRVVVPDIPARCSGCGGENVMRGGAPVSQCSYCKAQMVASPAKIAQVLDAVRGFRRSALLRKHAARRRVQGPRGQNIYKAAQDDEEWYQKNLVRPAYDVPGWPPVRAWLETVAGGLGGRALVADQGIAWLDESFGGDYPTGPWRHPRGAVALELEGYPGLVDLSFTSSRIDGPMRVALLLATEEPAQLGAAPAEAQATFAASGFELSVSQAGPVAISTEERASALTRSPHAAAELQETLRALLQVARDLRLGRPTAPRALPEPE